MYLKHRPFFIEDPEIAACSRPLCREQVLKFSPLKEAHMRESNCGWQVTFILFRICWKIIPIIAKYTKRSHPLNRSRQTEFLSVLRSPFFSLHQQLTLQGLQLVRSYIEYIFIYPDYDELYQHITRYTTMAQFLLI
jgi:hypothetical protein